MSEPELQHLVIMGVSGTGKSTVGEMLAERLAWPFADADIFHPPANVDKMKRGVALTDLDREPWLKAIQTWLTTRAQRGESSVVTCSALKRAYRELLSDAQGSVRFIHLDGAPALIEKRMRGRVDHFMPADLLPSQLETLEPLMDDEDGIRVDIDAPPAAIVAQIMDALGLEPGKRVIVVGA